MDYETPDGSHFSLQEIFDDKDGQTTFSYTSVVAFVDGKAFAGKVDAPIDAVDDGDLLYCLRPVPAENIHPLYQPTLTIAGDIDTTKHYLKTPSFTLDDSLPGRDLIARCVLNEAELYEHLRENGHPSLAEYRGCVVDEGRITRLVFHKYECNLVQFAESGALTAQHAASILDDVLSALEHLHGIGRAHNDLNPYNVCIDASNRAVVIDLDACLPFGECLLKGIAASAGEPVSSIENDWRALDEMKGFLQHAIEQQSSQSSAPCPAELHQ